MAEHNTPHAVAERIKEWIGSYGGENTATLLLYEAMNALKGTPAAAVREQALLRLMPDVLLALRNGYLNDSLVDDLELAMKGMPAAAEFQQRVQPWMMACFGEMIAGDREERNHRFLEESLELVQSLGCTGSEAHQLVDYVYGRPVGEPAQEVGGVMVTLAALCLANGMDMHAAAETELARIWTKVEQIRAKQAAKPKHSPLPAAAEAGPNYERMFNAACLDLAAINEKLGLDPDDGGATPIIDEIDALLARARPAAAVVEPQGGLAQFLAAAERDGVTRLNPAVLLTADEMADAQPIELQGVAETLADGGGFWRSCSGCHELNEGVDTGPMSGVLGCNLGNGCSECGGIGAVWDTTDYQAMADSMAASMNAAPQPSSNPGPLAAEQLPKPIIVTRTSENTVMLAFRSCRDASVYERSAIGASKEGNQK